MGKVAIFADVHGESDKLKRLMAKVREKYPDVEWYSVGDLIDRGPNSKEVLQICMDENVKAIIGNHEQYMQELVKNNQFDTFCMEPVMGGKATIESFGVDLFTDGTNYFPEGRPDKDIGTDLFQAIQSTPGLKDWIASLPPYRKIKVDNQVYWLIHAGLTIPKSTAYKVKSKRPIEYYSDEEMMSLLVRYSVNDILWTSPSFGAFGMKDNLFEFDNAIQIFGHRPVKEPIIKPHFIALDTGCGTCHPFKLSAIVLPEMEIFEVGDLDD